MYGAGTRENELYVSAFYGSPKQTRYLSKGGKMVLVSVCGWDVLGQRAGGMCRPSSSVAKNEFIVRHASLGPPSIDIDDNHTTLIELCGEGGREGGERERYCQGCWVRRCRGGGSEW